MSDYINRQDAINICFNGKVANNYDIAEEIKKLPTADVVPMEFHDKCMQIEIGKRMDMVDVVRCKDCIAWSRYGDTVIGYCDLSGIHWHDNDFCCYGERKEDDQTNDLR